MSNQFASQPIMGGPPPGPPQPYAYSPPMYSQSGGAMPSMTPSMMPSQMIGSGREESYIENILRLNLGKMATIYMTFENNSEWNAKVFKGNLEAAGRDHIIISDPKSGIRYLLLMVNLDYITFDEPLQYTYYR